MLRVTGDDHVAWTAFRDDVTARWPIERVLTDIGHAALPTRRPDGGYKISCIFHQEDTPSLHVYTQAPESCHCFGACDKGWSTIGLAMELMHTGYGETIRLLGERDGIRREDEEFPMMLYRPALISPRPQAVKKSNGVLAIEPISPVHADRGLIRMDKSAREFYHVDRLISDKMIERERLGRMPMSFTIPVWGPAGELWNVRQRRDDKRVTALLEKRLGHAPDQAMINKFMPKYFGLEGHQFLPALFGIGYVRRAPQRTSIVLVESELEVLALLSAGILAACLTNVGTHVEAWKDWWHELKDFDQVIVAYDNDETGQKKAKQIKEMFGEVIEVLPWPQRNGWGDDPGDFLRAFGPRAFYDLVRTVPPRFGKVECAYPVMADYWLAGGK